MDVSAGIQGKSELVLQPAFASPGFEPDKARMLGDACGDHLEHRSQLAVLNETNKRSFGVTPREVAQQLVDGIVEYFTSAPEFAFGDEDIRALVADEDIGPALFVEGFARARWIMG